MNSLFPSMRVLTLAFLFVTGSARADYTTTLQSLALPNYTGYVVDADATRPGAPGRSVIPAAVTLKYTRSGSTASAAAVDYTLTWSLVDSATGLAHTLDTGGSSLTSTLGVSWTPGVSEVTLTTQADLDPAARMDRNSNYRLRVVATPAGGVGTTHEQIPLLFRHFTNTVGNDTAFNLLGTAPFATLNRDWVILGPGVTGPVVSSTLFLERYDDFDLPVASADIPLRLRAQFTDLTDPMNPHDIPQVPGSATLPLTVANHTADDRPVETSTGRSLQIDASTLSTGTMSRVTAIFEYQDGDGSYVTLAQRATTPQRFFPMSGVLKFGSIVTRFTDLNGSPQPSGGNWSLTIPVGKGYLENRPEVTFSASVVVSFDANHDATVISGTAYFPTSFDQIGPEGAKIRIKREGSTMTTAGVSVTQLTVYFPAGFVASVPPSGVTTPEKNAAGRAIFRDQMLDADLRPAGILSITPLAVRRGVDPAALDSHHEIFCHHEKLPLWHKASSISLNTTTGLFSVVGLDDAAPYRSRWRHVRQVEMSLVEALHQPATVPPLHEKDTRPSNDSHFRNADLANFAETKSMTVKADARGVAVLSAQVPLGGGQARPHYPQGTGAEALEGIAFTSGVLQITNNAVVAEGSLLSGVTQVRQRYARDPRGLKCEPPGEQGADTGEFLLRPVGDKLRFTPELGLIGDGALNAAPLAWGTVDKKGDPVNAPTYRFAHRTVTPFTTGTFYQPGISLAGDVVVPKNDNRPGTLLLSGREKPGVDGLAYVERPVIIEPANTAPYFTDGLANYAGLNLRVDQEPPGMTGESLLAGQKLEYPLKTNGKYYVTLAGVTGLHQRQSTPGQPALLKFYDFPVSLDDFKLGFRDNQNTGSLCKGSVAVAFPVGVTQNFEELRFNERGQPTEARLPPGVQTHTLDHWGDVTFTAHSIGFRPQSSANPCQPAPVQNGFIEMGAKFTNLAGGVIPGSITAVLGFKATQNGTRGELISLADSESGGVAFGTFIDSRLHLPPNLKIHASSGGDYILNPITKGGFSDSSGVAHGSTDGFLTFAGKLAVPFFQELPVHVHLEPSNNPPPAPLPQIHFIGGWETLVAGQKQTFFTHPGSFDASHLGRPGELSLTNYRSLPEDPALPADPTIYDKYRTRAKKTWLGVVDFNYPLNWKSGLRRFESPRTQTDNLLIFDMKHKLRSLSASGAELEFGAEIANLPQFNPQRLIMDKLDSVGDGAFATFDTALRNASHNAVNGALNATGIANSIKALDDLIADQVGQIFESALNPAIDRLLNQAFGPAESAAMFSKAAKETEEQQLEAFVDQLRTQLSGERNAQGQIIDRTVAIANLKAALKNAIDGVGGDIDPSGEILPKIEGLVKELTGPDGKLKDVKEGIKTLKKIIEPDPEPDGPRQIFRKLTAELASAHENSDLIIAGGFLADKLEELEEIQEFQKNPFFDDLNAALTEAENQITNLQVVLNNPIGSPLTKDGTGWINVPANIDTLLAGFDAKLTELLNTLLPANVATLRDITGPGPTHLRAQKLRVALRRLIVDRVQESLLGEKIQLLTRTNFTPIRSAIREGTDQLISQITTTVKEAFQAQLTSGLPFDDNPLKGLLPDDVGLGGAAGELNAFFKGSNLRGYARTYGNSISELRLDGGIKFAPPGMGNGMEFAGYFLFKGPHAVGIEPKSCNDLNALAPKIQIMAGAKLGSRSRPIANAEGGSSTSFFDDMAVGGDLHFALRENGTPIGFTGNIGLRGPIDFGIVTLTGVDLTANVSRKNQYVVATAKGRIIQVIPAEVSIFAGHTCDLANVGNVLKGPLEHALSKNTFNNTNPKGRTINVGNLAGVVCHINGNISVNDVLKNYGGPDIPKDIVDISFNRNTVYAVLLRPPAPGETPKFILGYSEAGRLAAAVPLGKVGEVYAEVGGTLQYQLSLSDLALSAIIGPIPQKLNIHGATKIEGPSFVPDLEISFDGEFSRTGISFQAFDYDLISPFD